MSARFRVKRHRIDVSTSSPWVVKDRQRPAFVGQYATHALAIAAVDRRLSEERGIPTRREIREAMHGSEATA
jgi:hypothetical protein